MCEAGVNVKVIQDTLGHADISTTLNIYADVTKELKKDEFIGLDSYFTAKSRNQMSPWMFAIFCVSFMHSKSALHHAHHFYTVWNMGYVEMRRDMYFESLKKSNCKGLHRTAGSYVLGLDEVPTMKPME